MIVLNFVFLHFIPKRAEKFDNPLGVCLEEDVALVEDVSLLARLDDVVLAHHL